MDQPKNDPQLNQKIPQTNKTEKILKLIAYFLLLLIGEYLVWGWISVIIFCGTEGYGCNLLGIGPKILAFLFLFFDIWLFIFAYRKN